MLSAQKNSSPVTSGRWAAMSDRLREVAECLSAEFGARLERFKDRQFRREIGRNVCRIGVPNQHVRGERRMRRLP